MTAKFLIASAQLFLFVLPALAQGNADQNRVVYPTAEQIARYKRLMELLQHPTFITLRLASMRRDVPNEEPSTTPSPYTNDQWLHFQLFITQNSTEELVATSSGAYYEYRPKLIRDGDVLPYSRKAEEGVVKAEDGPRSGSSFLRKLYPGRESQGSLVDLEDWYDLPLRSGHYQLTVRKQFALNGDWVESNPVTFDVIPRKAPAPIPDGVSLRLVPDTSKPSAHGQYRLGYDEGVAVELINDSDQRVLVRVIDGYYGHRPQLFKDGKLIPYREETAKLIESKEKDPRLVEVVSTFFLDPKISSRVDGFSLKQWYGQLAPGLYRLTDRRRFEIDGPWTKDSAELVFEIVP